MTTIRKRPDMTIPRFPIYSRTLSINNAATATRARVLIEQNSMLKQDVAERMQIHPSCLSNLLRGRMNWTEAMARKFLKAVNGKHTL